MSERDGFVLIIDMLRNDGGRESVEFSGSGCWQDANAWIRLHQKQSHIMWPNSFNICGSWGEEGIGFSFRYTVSRKTVVDTCREAFETLGFDAGIWRPESISTADHAELIKVVPAETRRYYQSMYQRLEELFGPNPLAGPISPSG